MPKKILLADDSITIQKVVELTFSDGDYEVTAVNNGAKAIQKLAEMRPDIILSDIIMPEKNGYEVCEYVKSHPDFRNIPVVLLTGTFEPFDPDRAEKAGCDAVVTKPFESQSLIHKVEELIAQSQWNSGAASEQAPASVAEAASPWMDDTAGGELPVVPDVPHTHDAEIFGSAPIHATTEMPFEAPPPAPAGSPFGDDSSSNAFSGETRAFPRMNFEELQQLATPPAAPEPTPAPEPSSPWDEPAQFGGETRAFEKMSFDDFSSTPASPAAPEPEADSPFGASPDAEQFSSETRAFPRMNFDDMQQLTSAQSLPADEPPPTATSSWEPEAPAFGGETRAFPKLSFDDFQSSHEASAAPPQPPSWEPPAFAPMSDDSPFANADEPAFGGETRAFPKMSFEDFQQQDSPSSVPEPTPSEPEALHTIAWSPAAETPAESSADAPSSASPFSSDASSFDEPHASSSEPLATSPFADSAPEAPEEQSEPIPAGFSDQPVAEDMPFAADSTPEPEAEQPWSAPAEPVWSAPEPTSSAPAWSTETEPSWNTGEPTPEPLSDEPTWAQQEPAWNTAPEPAPSVEPEPLSAPAFEPAAAAHPSATQAIPIVTHPDAVSAASAAPAATSDLSEEQVDRIARRVVELLSDQVVRNIAWEVIPDLAEMVVKERIRQLEAEA